MEAIGLANLTAPGWVFLLACCVLATVPWYFIYRKVYDDGVLGRVFLGGIAAIAAIVVLASLTTERYYNVGWEAAIVVAFCAGFLCWHLYRFHTRASKSAGRKPCGLKDRLGCPYVEPGHGLGGDIPRGAVMMRRIH